MIPTMTLSRFIMSAERAHPGTTGELSDLLAAIGMGVKIIANLVAAHGLRGLSGYTSKTNVQGEQVHEIDQEADEILVQLLGSSGHFGLLLSEERDTVLATEYGHQSAKYVVAFDPLDGSSNLGSNIPVGTIFAIFRKRDASRAANDHDFLQPGSGVVAAGYGLYGAKTSFVYSSGSGVHGFTLDRSIGEFVLTEESIVTPSHGSVYSVNEGNSEQWTPQVSEYVAKLKGSESPSGSPYSLRYTGSLVADFDRNLKRGGVFLYPSDKKHARGKLRLLYECVPLAFIAEQAGGRAIDGERNILSIVPSTVHERCPLIIGSKKEIEAF